MFKAKLEIKRNKLIDRLNERFELLEAMPKATFKGQDYHMAGMLPSGERELLGKGFKKAGSYSGKEVSLGGSGGGADPLDPEKEFKPPKISGWEVVWDEPGTAGKRKLTKFVQMRKDDIDNVPCTQCTGEGWIEDPKMTPSKDDPSKIQNVKCPTCKGLGILNKRVNAFMRSLAARGLGPQFRLKRLSKVEKKEWPWSGLRVP